MRIYIYVYGSHLDKNSPAFAKAAQLFESVTRVCLILVLPVLLLRCIFSFLRQVLLLAMQVEGKIVLRFALCYGFRNLRNIVTKIKSGKCEYHFLEIMACPSGSIPLLRMYVNLMDLCRSLNRY